jgi:hypothetical protein
VSGIGKKIKNPLEHLDKGIGPDETVVFYPSIGIDRGTECRIEVRGRVFEEHAFLKPINELLSPGIRSAS